MISSGQVTATDHGRYWPTPLWVIVFVDMPADPFAGYFDEADEAQRVGSNVPGRSASGVSGPGSASGKSPATGGLPRTFGPLPCTGEILKCGK